MLTPDEVRSLLAVSPAAVRAALRTLAARQTPAEQRAGITKDENGVGFNAFDAPVLQPLADAVLNDDFLAPVEIHRAGRRLAKYAAQLAASGALDYLQQALVDQLAADPFAAAAVAQADANRRK